MDRENLQVDIYQIADDSLLKANRSDGTGWDWCWADWQRDWMNATPQRYAYRCLPLTIMNQTGWWIKNPAGFTATWRGPHDGGIEFEFDVASDTWGKWISCQFGAGIITWNTPFLFRTQPIGSRLLVCGPPNYFKINAHPLMALIESDWMTMSFTMNWKILEADRPVRFEAGEPLFQAIPLLTNVCAELEKASVSFQRLPENPELHRAYSEWDHGRRRFQLQKATGEAKPSDWQKDYFQGRDPTGRPATGLHMQKIKPPAVRLSAGEIIQPARSLAAVRNGNNGNAPTNHVAMAFHSDPTNMVINKCPGDLQMPVNSASPAACEHAALSSRLQPTLGIAVPSGPRAEQKAAASNGDRERPDTHQAQATVRIAINDDWRSWIAENLIAGQTPESIGDVMKLRGFSDEVTAREIKTAAESPYIRGGELLSNRLKKRDWLLAIYRKCHRLHPASHEIERRHRLARDDFLRDFYSRNLPVVVAGMIDDWPAIHKWNVDYFAQAFGNREVEVQPGPATDAKNQFAQQKRPSKGRFGDVVERMRNGGDNNDFYLTATNASINQRALPELWDDIIHVPEYLESRLPGSYLWMGPQGTITPFHHDLGNILLAQVIGRQRVKLTPSWDIPFMRNHLHCYSHVDGKSTPCATRPGRDEPQVYELTLEPGELLFVPVGWMQHVQSLEFAVTITFTNFVFDNDFASNYATYCPL